MISYFCWRLTRTQCLVSRRVFSTSGRGLMQHLCGIGLILIRWRATHRMRSMLSTWKIFLLEECIDRQWRIYPHVRSPKNCCTGLAHKLLNSLITTYCRSSADTFGPSATVYPLKRVDSGRCATFAFLKSTSSKSLRPQTNFPSPTSELYTSLRHDTTRAFIHYKSLTQINGQLIDSRLLRDIDTVEQLKRDRQTEKQTNKQTETQN